MINGISHITFMVKDLERTADLLIGILDAKEVYSSSTAKYFLINDMWIALNKGESLAEKSYNHVAFRIHEEDVEKYLERIKGFGLEIKPGRPRGVGERSSIYFYDYDNHLFELHTGTLEERLGYYADGD